jgi:hypothetical protein
MIDYAGPLPPSQLEPRPWLAIGSALHRRWVGRVRATPMLAALP